jgi:hypothetical protein
MITLAKLTGNYFASTGKNPGKTDCFTGAQNLQIYSHNLHKIIILAAKHPIIT